MKHHQSQKAFEARTWLVNLNIEIFLMCVITYYREFTVRQERIIKCNQNIKNKSQNQQEKIPF